MQFREGATVVTADGEKAGTIDRVVIDPDTKEITHLVIKKGLLFPEDKVVPLSLVGPSSAEAVKLRPGADDLEELPEFEETHYVRTNPPPSRSEPAPERQGTYLYWYPPIGSGWRLGGFPGYRKPKFVTQKRKNIPPGTVALKEGARVVAQDGESVGEIERVFTDPQADRATHLLLSKGLILPEKKLIPTSWITGVLEDEVFLSVDSELVASLPEYQLQQN